MESWDHTTAWFVKLDQYHQSLLTDRRKLQSRGLSTAPAREKNLPVGLSIQFKSQHYCKLLGHHIVHIFCTVSSLLTLEICLCLSVPLFSSKILVSLSFFYSKGIIQFVLYSFQYVRFKISSYLLLIFHLFGSQIFQGVNMLILARRMCRDKTAAFLQ